MNVSELMSTDIQACRPSDTLADAARAMWEHDLGVLPVLDDASRVVAAITDRDICMAAYTQGRALSELRVDGSMSHHLQACEPSTSVEDALDIMARARVRRLPVVDGEGRIQGVLSLADVVRRIDASGEGADQRQLSIRLASTMAAIATPSREPSVELEPAAPPRSEEPSAQSRGRAAAQPPVQTGEDTKKSARTKRGGR